MRFLKSLPAVSYTHLIHENQGKAWKGCGQFPAECTHLGCGGPFRAVHADGKAQHQGADSPFLDELDNAGNSVRLMPVDSFYGMGHDAHGVRGGNADAGFSVVDAQGGVDVYKRQYLALPLLRLH